jgi:hypothetical protein
MTSMHTTASTAEAMELLKGTRAGEIANARMVAAQLIAQNGRTHTRAVWEEMVRLGLARDTDPPAFWLGCVFQNQPQFKWTGEWTQPDETEFPMVRAHANRPIKIWEAA